MLGTAVRTAHRALDVSCSSIAPQPQTGSGTGAGAVVSSICRVSSSPRHGAGRRLESSTDGLVSSAVGSCASGVTGYPLLWLRRSQGRSPRIAEPVEPIARGANTYLARQFRAISWDTAIMTAAIPALIGW